MLCALAGGCMSGCLVCYKKQFVRGPIHQTLVNWLRAVMAVVLVLWMTAAFRVSMGHAPEYSGGN